MNAPILHCPSCPIAVPRWPCQHAQFDVVIADPPWSYDSPRAIVGNGGRGAEDEHGHASRIVQADVTAHYTPMTLDAIKALPVSQAAKRDAILFLWITNPLLAEGVSEQVVRAWGFTPKSVITWAKIKHGTMEPSKKTGHWFRSASEHMVFATRGKMRRPENWPALPTWLPLPRIHAHSSKPDEFYQWAEMTVPGGTYLEVFAQTARHSLAHPDRWAVFGNKVEDADPRARWSFPTATV